MTLLSVQELSVTFRSDAGAVLAVGDVSFDVAAGETMALVGESGSGKSVTSLAIMRLLAPPPACVVSGRVMLSLQGGGAIDLLGLSEPAMQAVRGKSISMIFQEPMSSLNPVHMVGEQIAEAIRFHRRTGKRAALAAAAELLDVVGIQDATRRLRSFPHQMSGGMRQRVMIAMALACDPAILIADEPTTALDVTIQAQILDLLRRLQERTGMAVIFITHNLGVVAELADRVTVMYAGRVVEQAAVGEAFARPLMPYTRGLLRSVPGRQAQAYGLRTKLLGIRGTPPNPQDLPVGCAFHPRCDEFAPGRCDAEPPPLEAASPAHAVRCVRWRELA